jgi:hypothetical protein
MLDGRREEDEIPTRTMHALKKRKGQMPEAVEDTVGRDPPAPDVGEGLANGEGPEPVAPGKALSPPTSLAGPFLASVPTPEALAALEQRVRRLEDAFALIQSARPAEAKIASPPLDPSDAVRAELPARPLPDLTLEEEPVRQSPPFPPASLSPEPARGPRHWLLFEAVTDARVILRMFVDPRYRMTWPGRVLPLVLLAMFVTSKIWLPLTSLPLFGELIDKTFDLLLGFFLFKVVSREARRYRQTSPDLPRALRL